MITISLLFLSFPSFPFLFFLSIGSFSETSTNIDGFQSFLATGTWHWLVEHDGNIVLDLHRLRHFVRNLRRRALAPRLPTYQMSRSSRASKAPEKNGMVEWKERVKPPEMAELGKKVLVWRIKREKNPSGVSNLDVWP